MIRTATGGLLTTLSISLLAAVAPAPAAQAAEAAALSVSVVAAGGTGCSDATATASAVDGSSFTIDSDAFFAWSGAGAATANARRNCLYALQITAPAGWTYAVQGADYSGYAQLSEGVTGTQAAQYYFQGDSTTVSGTHPLTGPYSGSFQTTDAFGTDELVYAACGSERFLNVNTEVRVTPASTGVNWIFLDPSVTVHLAWQPCS